ncbi:gamma-glutamylcyclotransferase family protein [Natronorubrum halophilum]|uniref:gamma-glutamylcyclotransferase family protein n=1 Tax=Natronorubrum halophilum TaxID=1702106 RepID=UPI000EF68ED8|nr:gamma-glutamylcyclotransferase family protein [Natronorubrum halophilum]
MLVFVYGTLTDPKQAAALLEECSGEYEFVGRATLEGLHRVDGRYPTLVPGGSVEGRLLAVDEPALERLDRYEGVDRGLYARVSVPRADGRSVWIYVGDPERLGVDTDAPWPAGRSFRDSLQTYLLRAETVVLPHE